MAAWAFRRVRWRKLFRDDDPSLTVGARIGEEEMFGWGEQCAALIVDPGIDFNFFS